MKPEIAALVESAMHNPDADIGLDLDMEGLDALWDAHVHLDAILAATKRVRAAVDAELGVAIGEGAAARLDDFLVRYRPRRTLRCQSPESLLEYAGDDYHRLFNPNYLKIGELKGIAKERGHDPNVVVDSLIDWEYGEPTVEVQPLYKAPQYAHSMEHGEVRETRRRAS